MSGWQSHLILLPIVLPLAAGLLMLVFDGRSRNTKAMIGVVATAVLVAVAIALLRLADAGSPDGPLSVYLLGNWPAPFGIVLVLDQLSALMLLLTSIMALAALMFSLARWHSAGVHFHPLFQFLLMGLNGSFLTGDLFNLFVFFEVMLAASYGLVLHGSGTARVKAGMHYIVVNLAASYLFLIGVSLIYGATGTLNMADLAASVSQVPHDDRALLETGAAILGVAFLVKAGAWPLSFWLPTAYASAAPPVAAIFAIMTKVGIYVILRLWLLTFGENAGESAQFGERWLLYGGMLTIAFGMMGVLASQGTAQLAAYSVLVSSGTLLAAIGTNQVSVTAGALFYLAGSTLALCALFLLIELSERGREFGADMLAVTGEAYGETDEGEPEDEEQTGIPVPATMAILGLSFLGCATLLSGLPPLSGFLGKFAILSGLFYPAGGEGLEGLTAPGWTFVVLLILSGFASLIAMTRAGIRTFWGAIEREVPRIKLMEIAPIALLLLLCMTITVRAGPIMRYMEETALSLHEPTRYVEGVLATRQTQSSSRETRP